MRYSNLEKCSDYEYLKTNLSASAMKIVEGILDAYWNGRIDMIVPRDVDGEPLFDGEFKLIIRDKFYRENGLELLVMKWVEDMECTGYLTECLEEE